MYGPGHGIADCIRSPVIQLFHMVKMKDYGFFLPVAAIGKTVVIDGEVKMKTIRRSKRRIN